MARNRRHQGIVYGSQQQPMTERSFRVEGQGGLGPKPKPQWRDWLYFGCLVHSCELTPDSVALASSADDFFREVPRATVTRGYEKLARLKPDDKSAYLQLRGSIPAEEPERGV